MAARRKNPPGRIGLGGLSAVGAGVGPRTHMMGKKGVGIGMVHPEWRGLRGAGLRDLLPENWTIQQIAVLKEPCPFQNSGV